MRNVSVSMGLEVQTITFIKFLKKTPFFFAVFEPRGLA